MLAINNQEYVEILERPCDSPNNIDRENLLEDSSSTKSFDSAYEAWSRFGDLRLEHVVEQREHLCCTNNNQEVYF